VELTGISRTLLCAGQAAVDAEGHPAHAGDMKAQLQLNRTTQHSYTQAASCEMSSCEMSAARSASTAAVTSGV
jgi:hypothetical protein